MTNEQYRAHEAVSYSDLIWMEKSPWHFINRNSLRKETPAMRLGTLLHLAVLETNKFKNSWAMEPTEMPDGTEINRRVKAHREYLAGWKQTNEGKIFVRQEEMDMLTNMVNVIQVDPNSVSLLSKGAAEVPVFGEIAGVKMKARCDYIIDNHPIYGRVVVDLKKTQDASEFGFSRSIYNYRYHCQAWLYKTLFNADHFMWIAIEETQNVPPPAIYRCHESVLDQGENLTMNLLNKLKACREQKRYHGYTDGVKDAFLPSWSAAKEKDGEL